MGRLCDSELMVMVNGFSIILVFQMNMWTKNETKAVCEIATYHIEHYIYPVPFWLNSKCEMYAL